ncbi:MAG: outer membrane protein assembly factor BamB family protein [Planctomycetota bacterium]
MKMMRKYLLMTLCVSVCVFTAAAFAEGSDQAKVSDELVSHTLIRQAGWTYNWQLNLPVKEAEVIANIGVMGPNLYALTNTNVLFCIDRQSGRTRYAIQLSAGQLPICRPLYYDEKFWFIVGSEMLVFDPKIGQMSAKQQFTEIGNTFECGISRNTDHVYVTGSDHRLHVYNVNGYWHEFSATADNDSAIISTVATDDLVVFATVKGNIVGMNPNKAQKYWQFDATGEIKSDLVLDTDAVYVGSRDSKLYKLDLEKGKLAWRAPFHSGAPIKDPFTVGRDTVYLYNSLNGLYGVSKETGKSAWQVPNGKGMVCEDGDKAFVYATPGILKVMDNAKGKELYSVNFSQVQLHARNITDATMYVGDLKGRIMSVTVKEQEK